MSQVYTDTARSLKIETIRTLLAVAETGSFRRAGSRMGLGQSAVSRRIQRLENVLGVSLFERRPSGARLTPAGSNMAERVRVILNDLQATVEAARSTGVGERGHLKIGLVGLPSKGLLRTVLHRFSSLHGDVDLCLFESSRSELLTLLSHRQIDAVYAAGEPETQTGDGFVAADEKVYLAVASDSAFAEQERLVWKDLANVLFVTTARECGRDTHDYIVRHASGLDERARVSRYRLGRDGIMSLVGLGFGVSLVTDHWRAVSYPNVVFIPVGDPDEYVPFSLTWRPENDNPALRRFISLARIEVKRTGNQL